MAKVRTTERINVTIPKELWSRLKDYPELNISGVVQKALKIYMDLIDEARENFIKSGSYLKIGVK